MFDRRSPRRLASFAWGAVMVQLLAGCAGSLDPAAFEDGGGGSSPAMGSSASGSTAGASSSASSSSAGCASSVPTTIFVPTCGASGCHNAASKQEGLDLTSPGLASRLVDVREAEQPSLNLFLVSSAQPDQSVLLTKLGASVPYGAQMPLGGAPLTAQQIACVRSWIVSQAGVSDGGRDQ